ncbi:MAG: lysophospholipase [Anaerolineaceae bacterium]|nr:lysophospholipase [Anaerolineaceae bacterium]
MLNQEFFWQSSDGLKLFGQIWEPEHKVKAVVALVHGLGEHSGRYQHVAEFLTQQNYSLAGFDLRGHGRSEGIRGHAASYQAIMDDIEHFLKEVKKRYPGIPCFLYGHSLGGNLVLYFELDRHPKINGIIATSPGLGTAFAIPKTKLFFGKILYSVWPSLQMDNGLDTKALSHDPKIEQAYTHDPLVHHKISARLGLDLINSGEWIVKHAAEFSLPLLLMQGSADRIVNPQITSLFAEKVPANLITFKFMENYRHELHNDEGKEEVFQLMLSWLNLQAENIEQ